MGQLFYCWKFCQKMSQICLSCLPVLEMPEFGPVHIESLVRTPAAFQSKGVQVVVGGGQTKPQRYGFIPKKSTVRKFNSEIPQI